ncbi:trichohyalin [Xyrauchen texanus]|uniref:trichohyalin n=1 Tax=Xyrauchen texanus TaxID=154827 RepID=UPI00224225D9|nr:trichohyalin [Xyrauchen texanus]
MLDVMPGETETDIPATGAVFTFGKSTIAGNVPSRLWLKNDIPVQISCGQSHSAFVTEQGRLFVFGSNSRGQLGLVTKGPATKPIYVKALKVERIQLVACGTDHTLVSTLQGEVFATGGNSDGQLGLGHCNDSISFQRLHPFCDSAPIKLLSAGNHTSAVLTEDGRLFLWGDNSVGQLGLGNDSRALLPKELKLGQPVQWVSCGYIHSALVTNNGDVFTFGESADGRLGLSADQLANHNYPQRVDSLQSVLQVACGGKHTLALTEDELYSCGCGEFGQLGLGTLVFEADTPVAVGHFRKGRVIYVTCGENHSALITDSGLLYTFGDGRHGKLGHGDENFTNQFSPTVCQRFFDYYAMTVACGSSHTLVFARPRQQESEEVCLEDEDMTYFYLDRCFNSMLQGKPLEHIPEPALISQPAFLATFLPSCHRWSLSTRSRRRQRESSSAQFGLEFLNFPPLTTSFTTQSLTGNILQPLRDTAKHFKTDAYKEFSSTSVTQPAKYDFSSPARTPPSSPVSKSARYINNVGTAENSMSDKKQNEKDMARLSSIGRVETRAENAPQQTPPTEQKTGSVSHQSLTESLPPSNRKCRKRRSGDPGNTTMKEHLSVTTASQSEMESNIYKKRTQIKNNESKGQTLVVKSSPDIMSAQDTEKSNETPSTNTNIDTTAKNVGSTKIKDRKGTTLGKIKPHIKSSPVKKDTSSLAIDQKETKSDPVQIEQVKTTPTKVQDVKSPSKVKEVGSPVKAIKRVRPPFKVQDVPYGTKEDGEVESTPYTDAQRDVKLSLGKSQEVRSTLINIQEQGNTTTVKIPDKIQNAPEKGKGKNDVDTKENTGAFSPKKAKTPSPLSVSIPKQRDGKACGEGARGMSKAKKGKPVEAENFQLRPVELGQETTGVKRQNDNDTLKDSNIYFPLIENRQSSSNTPATEKSQSDSSLQFDHKKSQSPNNKVLIEQKQGFPSIKTLAPERSHSVSSLWSINQSATNESSTSKETESLFGKLLSPSSSSPQHRQSPLKENKLALKTVESEPVLVTETSQSVRKPQAEQSIIGSVVSSLPSLALASGAPLLIKVADVLSETSNTSTALEQYASVPQETTGNNIQKATVQDVSAISENQETGDSSTKKQSESTKCHPEDGEDVEKEMLVSGNAESEDEEDEKDSEIGEEKRGEEENFTKEEDESEEGGQEKQNSPFEETEEGESVNDGDSRDGESAEKGLEEGEEEEGEEEENGAAGDEEGDSDTKQNSNSEKEKSEGEGSGDSEVTSKYNKGGEEDGEESEIQKRGNDDSTEKKEEGEKGEAESEEDKDKESGDEEEEEWDEGSERAVEDDETKEKTDVEKEQEGESSNEQSGQEEKMERGKESDNEDEENKEKSDEEEEKGESEEQEVGSEIEEEEYETGEKEEEVKVKSEGGSNGEEEADEGEGEEDEESEEDDEVGNEVEKENQEKEIDHEEEEEENGDQANEEEENEEEENEEEENGTDEEENNEQVKDRKGEEDEEEGVEEEEEESNIDEEEEEEEEEATKWQREKIESAKSVTKKPANAKDSQGHEKVNAEKERQKTAEGNEDSERQELGEKTELQDGGKEEGEWKIDASEEEEEEGEAESEEDKDKESGDEEEEEWDEGSERAVEDDETKEKTDVEEEQEGESSNEQSGQEEEKREQGKESDNEDEETKEGSDDDEEKEKSEEEDGSEEEEEEYETEEEEKVMSEGGSNGEEEADEGDGEEEDEESEEDDEVGNEVEKENQEEEIDHEEEEEENGDQANEEEENEEEENEEEENEEEDNEEEENGMDEQGNNEQLKERKGEEEDEEECVEEEEEESEIDEEEEVEEEEEEATKWQREKIESAKSVTKKPANAKDSHGKVNAEKEKHKKAEGNKDRERQELGEKIEVQDGEKEECEGKIDTSEEKLKEEENIDISETQEMDSVDEDLQGDKLNEMMEEHEEETIGSEEEEEEETEQKEENITAEKNGRKQRANYEQEEESEEEDEDDEEEESEEEEEEEEEQESDEEEEEEERIEQRKAPKQSIKPKALSVDRQGVRQTIAQRDREKTVKRDLQGKKQTASGAQDPQFWNNVLPQYLNLK